MGESIPLLAKQKFKVYCEQEHGAKTLFVTNDYVIFPLKGISIRIPLNDIIECKCIKMFPIRTCEDIIYIQTKDRTYWFSGRQSHLIKNALKEKNF